MYTHTRPQMGEGVHHVFFSKLEETKSSVMEPPGTRKCSLMFITNEHKLKIDVGTMLLSSENCTANGSAKQ